MLKSYLTGVPFLSSKLVMHLCLQSIIVSLSLNSVKMDFLRNLIKSSILFILFFFTKKSFWCQPLGSTIAFKTREQQARLSILLHLKTKLSYYGERLELVIKVTFHPLRLTQPYPFILTSDVLFNFKLRFFTLLLLVLYV